MRFYYLFFFAFIASMPFVSGQTASDGDTTIYAVAEEMPRFPACENLDTTLVFKNQCAQQALLKFMYNNLVYPQEARENNLEGSVVVSFVVEKNGFLTQPKILRDIGGGGGLEVLRVIELMNQADIRWVPGKQNGQAVRVQFNLPIRFKLEEALPYIMVGRDTLYTTFEKPLEFKGGSEALEQFLTEKLDYPPSGNDSCLIGRVEIQLLVKPDASVSVLEMTDYCDLGFDFWYEATDAATSTIGKWEPATYEGRKVPAAYDLTFPFVPTAAGCKEKIDRYQRADQLAQEGASLFNTDDPEPALAKLSEAIALFPDNAELLIMRGQAYLDLNRFEEACVDLSKARNIALINWYDTVLPLICR
ncbi:MAG TPA: energy transducer TonB [Saprospiraceae bacterium]|nr:energy transducer TonB [Saprospiraceae bacterium]HMQ81802.1 energy transducer TonB [Saprospiraceae bacterium]